MLLLVLYTLSITTTFAIDVSNSLESDLFLPEAFGTKFGVLTSQQKNYSLVDNLDVKSKLRWEYATRSGYRIGIYDNVLTSPHLRILQAWTTYKLGSWSYRLHETDVKGGQNHVSENDFPWYIELDVIKFSESIVGKQLQKVVAKFSQEESMNYHPFKVVGHVIRRGDFPKVYTDADSEANEVSMMIYLNKEWRKNDYGDLYLYDDDKEIVAGVVPRHGRIVVWQSSIPYLPRPPSVAFKPGQLFLHIYFTKNQTKVHDIHSKWQKNEQNRSVQQDEFFTPEEHNRALKEIAVQSHLVSEAKSKDGKRIVTFDGLFSKHDLDNLRSAILNYGVYYYDDSYNKESDNVQWIAAFKVDSYIKSNLWKITQEVAKHVSGGQSEWFPYDVSCNLIRNADTTQIHHDCDVHEGEWTFLLYLNPEWTINDYGETVFYERNDDDTEIITEVLPKYGRVVIFQGVIPHSARPPSTNFTGARLSFAVKLSKNEWTGRQKACQELFRQFSAVKRGLVAPKKIFDEKDKASSDTPGNHQPHDHSRKTKSNEESSDDDDDDDYDDDDDDNDDDPELLKIEESLSKDNIDVEDLRTLFRDLTKHHQQAIENLGEELQKYL